MSGTNDERQLLRTERQWLKAPVMSAIGLAECDGIVERTFAFSGFGVITPISASDMCLTLDDMIRNGRRGTNQIKAQTL